MVQVKESGPFAVNNQNKDAIEVFRPDNFRQKKVPLCVKEFEQPRRD